MTNPNGVLSSSGADLSGLFPEPDKNLANDPVALDSVVDDWGRRPHL